MRPLPLAFAGDALVRADDSVLAHAAELEHLVERARDYVAGGKASSTRRAYDSSFRAFEQWCAARALTPLPATPATVAVYLAALADEGRAVNTIERALAAVAHAHRSAGHDWSSGVPAIRETMAGIRRKLAGAPVVKKAPAKDDELAALVATLDGGLAGLRDRALLTLGWFTACRRSELVALRVEDLDFAPEGLRVVVRRSKSDQEGRGLEKGVVYAGNHALCPVRALKAWLDAAGIKTGAVFRAIDRHGRMSDAALCDRSVARIVQRAAERAGLDPTRYGGHSLRAGFVTTAAKKGKSLDAIMRQTGHKSVAVVRGYIRHATVFDDNPSSGLV